MSKSVSVGHRAARLDVRGNPDAFLIYSLPGTRLRQVLSAPRIHVNGRAVVLALKSVEQRGRPRRLPNGAVEHVLGGPVAGMPGLELEVVVRVPRRSPVFRFHYRLISSRGAHRLTKPQGQDVLDYFSCAFEGAREVREVQLSAFNYSQHYFLPQEAPIEPARFDGRDSVMGPILTASGPAGTVLLAYEHGSQVGNRYLEYRLAPGGRATLAAVKGNYYDGRTIGDGAAFETLWFQIGGVPGDVDDLAAAYRDFVLKDFALRPAAREPLIFYNTWGHQFTSFQAGQGHFLDFMTNDWLLDDIDRAHRLGAEVYVLDAGWSETPGDWTVSPKRLPDNLKAVCARLKKHGMRLGLWFEPSTVGYATKTMREHGDKLPALRDGKRIEPWDVWGTDTGTSFCLASDFADIFANRLIELVREFGVSYFKWDGVNQWCEGDWYTHRCDCDAAGHHHGTAANPARERAECSQFEQVRSMNRIVEKVQEQCPDLIVDFDITEAERSVGLAFLSTGKYFHSNNPTGGQNGDLARALHVRAALAFDRWIPANLFLTHLLPPDAAQPLHINLATLVLGFNGIWGDLRKFSAAQMRIAAEFLARYKAVRGDLVRATPVRQGGPGSCPEAYEKIAPNGRGAVVLFASHGTHRYVTRHKVAGRFWAGEGVTVRRDRRGRAVVEFSVRAERYGAGVAFFGTR